MPKRNAPEFYYSEKTGLYRKRVTLPDGSRQDLYSKSPAELRKRVAQARQDIEEGRYSLENPTVAEYAVRWCKTRLLGLSASRKRDYTNSINNHILPGLGGNTLMRNITEEDIKQLIGSKARMSKSFNGKLLSTLKQMFAAAANDGVIRKSPCENIHAGGKKTVPKEALTEEQQAALMEAVSGTPAWPFVMLGLYAGLRKEEILGLKWDCVYLAASPPYLRVERVVTYGEDDNTPIVTSQLKTDAARRVIPIVPPLLQCLQSWRIHNPYEYVVPNSTGGPRSKQSARRLWEIVENRTAGKMQRWDKELGKMVTITRRIGEVSVNHKARCTLDFTCTPHQLRHTYITNLCASGKVDIKSIQYLAGHENVQMTLNIYAHVVNRRPKDLHGKVAAALTSSAMQVPPTGTP